MSLSSIYSIHPKVIIKNNSDEELNNLRLSYPGVEKKPIVISKLYPKSQEVKILITDNLVKPSKLMLSYDDKQELIVYDKLIGNSNKTIIITLDKENDKLTSKTKVEDIKMKPTDIGVLIGKFYNIIIGILIILAGIIYLVQKFAK